MTETELKQHLIDLTRQLMNGLLSVTALVRWCDNIDYEVSSIDIAARTVTYVYDTGEVGEFTCMPVLNWIDITV